MIASFSRNFIFIKTRKTAGTSVEIALTPFLGPEDILTPISLEDELLRLQDGKVAARNYCNDRARERKIAKAILRGKPERWRKHTRQAFRDGALQNHTPASVIRERVPEAFWNKAFKFTVERHPYEKVVSAAYWRAKGAADGSIARRIAERAANRTEDLKLYTIDGEVVVDDIIRQENLEADLARVALKIGIDTALALPRAKGSTRSDRRPASEILTAEQKAMIYERHRRTFDLMGYEP